MALDDFIDSSTSVTGAGLTSAAAVMMPGAAVSAWILAAMQIASIADPAQMSHAASAHDALATKISGFKTQLDDAVNQKIPPAQLSSDDKNALLTNQVEPAKAALDSTAKVHTTIANSLRTQAGGSQSMGWLSLGIGTAMMTLAVSTTAEAATLFGIPAALAQQFAGSSTMSGIFKSALTLFQSVMGLVAKLLTTSKMALGGLGLMDVMHSMMGGTAMSTSKPIVAPMQVMSA